MKSNFNAHVTLIADTADYSASSAMQTHTQEAYKVHAVASTLSLCVAFPPSVVCLCDCDQEPCVYGLGLFGHWQSWPCLLFDAYMKEWQGPSM